MTSIVDEQSGGPARPCEPLLQLATADLYARNPFRVLGVRVDASRQEIQRLQNRREMQAKLGMGDEAEDLSAFPVQPDAERDRAALEILNNPIDRFLAELFWFWPEGAEDDGLHALEAGDVASAIATWERAIPVDPVRARHNLAVLHHARALGASQQEPRLGDERRALELWGALSEERSFWREVSERAVAAGDRRVSATLVSEIRGSFPLAILTVHARVALAFAEKGETVQAKAQIGHIRESGLNRESQDAAIRSAVAAPRSRLAGAVAQARRKWEAAPQDGAEVIEQLQQRGARILDTIDALLEEEDPTRRGIHDDFADALISGVVEFGMTTQDWSRAVELIDGAARFALGDAVKGRIAQNRSVAVENAEGSTQWCAPGYWELPPSQIDDLQSARESADAGDFRSAIDRLVGLDPSIGYPLRRALAYSLGREALRVYHERTAAGERRDGLLKAAEYEKLADELDPGHPDISNQLSETKSELDKIGVRMPTSRALRERLHGTRTRGEDVPAEVPEPDVCYFCGSEEPDGAASIEVPLCGDLQTVEYILGPGHSYKRKTIVVPRCIDCVGEHADLPQRVEAWRAAYALSGADASFPHLLAPIRELSEDEEDARRTLERAEERSARAEAAAQAALAGPTSCERCGSVMDWDEGICKACDGELYRVGARDAWAAVAVAALAFLNLFFGAGTSFIRNAAASLAGPGRPLIEAAGLVAVGGTALIGFGFWLLLAALSYRRRLERDDLRTVRRSAFEADRAKRSADIEWEVGQAQRAVEEAEAVLTNPRSRLEEARGVLQDARFAARAKYETECPWPELPSGVRPESEYTRFEPLVSILSDGWGYGTEPMLDMGKVRTEPDSVAGLVS